MKGNGDAIDPFPTPDFLSFGIPHVGNVLPALFFVVFAIWLLYTVVLAYHWFRYSYRSFLAVPMVALHIVVSGVLILLAVAGLR